MSEVHNPESENWCLKSKTKSDVRSLMKSKVWCPTSVRKLSELCLNSEVLRMSVQNLKSKNQSLKSKVCPMSKIRVWNQSPKSASCLCLSLKPVQSNTQNYKSEVESLKSEVESVSEVRSKSEFRDLPITEVLWPKYY